VGESSLFGHEAAWLQWHAALASGRMHHGWILAGPQGLGKGLFARAAAAELVAAPGIAQPPLAHHPDILIPEHPPENKEEAKKREDGQAYATKRAIPIDQIRLMQQRLITRPTLGTRRAVIIDPADDMEKAAVNALLKSLEEPPAGTFFLLVAHRLGRLLPTIRSRCRVLRFAPLADDVVGRILAEAAPQVDAATRAAAVAAAQGSPGVALGFVAAGLGGAHGLMLRLLRGGDAGGDAGIALRGALAEKLGPRPPRERLLALIELARALLAGELRAAPPARQARIIEAYSALTRLAGQAPSYNFEPPLLALEIAGVLAGVAGAGRDA